MSIAAKYNKGNVKWDINTEGFEYLQLSDLGEGTQIQVCGLYINHKGKFGPAPVLIGPTAFYNLPSYMTETVQAMLQDPELIEEIKAGKVFAEVRKFTDSTYGRESWTVDWL